MIRLKIAVLIIIGLMFYADNKTYAMNLCDGIRENQFNIITVTRNKINRFDEPLLFNEIFALFKNIDNMLGGICFDDKCTDEHFRTACNLCAEHLIYRTKRLNQNIMAYYSSLYSKLMGNHVTALSFSDAEKLFFKMNQDLYRKIQVQKIDGVDFNKPTLLVFQEAIFSQSHLLNDEYVEFIINLCKELTSSYNVSIHINLLHQFDNGNCPSWIQAAEEEKNVLGQETNTTVANYSLIISKGEIVNVYVKTQHDDSLQKEEDCLIKGKFKLKIGSLKSYDLWNELNFQNFVATRICADMNLLQEGSDKCNLLKNGLDSQGILIIQSNTFSLSNMVSMLTKMADKDVSNSYLNRYIVHCDPGNGASVFQIEQKGENLQLFAYKPINSLGQMWPKYDESNLRISSGIEVDVNYENCEKIKNGKLFYVNVWPFCEENLEVYPFHEQDL